MADEITDNDQKQLTVTAQDLNRVIPKLASRVLIGNSGENTLLTFVMDIGNDQAQVIETLALDSKLAKGLLRLLEEDVARRENQK